MSSRLVDVVADREQVARPVVQELVIHVGKSGRVAAPALRAGRESGRAGARHCRVGCQLAQRRECRAARRSGPGRSAPAGTLAARRQEKQVIAAQPGIRRRARQPRPEPSASSRILQRGSQRVGASRSIASASRIASSVAGATCAPRDSRLRRKLRARSASSSARFARPRARRACRARPVEHARIEERLVGQREQTRPQRQQMAGEVAAVDRRDVARRQRLQGPRVVPVVEVAVVALERCHGAKASRRALDQRAGGDVAEIVGGEVGEQRQADVGRRGAVGDHAGRVFLEVVGRQPVVLRADERSKNAQVLRAIRRRKSVCAAVRRASRRRSGRLEPPGEDGRAQPQQRAPAAATVSAVGLSRRKPTRTPRARRAGAIHIERKLAPRLPARRARSLVDGRPFQQAALRERACATAVRRIASRLTHGLVRQAGEPERRLARLPPVAAHDGATMLAQRACSRGLRSNADEADQQRRDQDDAEHGERPGPRARRDEPADQQQQHERRRHEAAPQVVEDLPARQRRRADCVRCVPPAAGTRGSSQLRDLPVAADPACAGATSPRSARDSPRTAPRRSPVRSARSSLRAGRG